MRLLGDLPSGHEDVYDQEKEEHGGAGGEEEGGGIPIGDGWVIMTMIMTMPVTRTLVGGAGGDFFFGHLGAVFIVRVTVGGVEGFTKGGAAFAGEGEVVPTLGDDFISREEAFKDLDTLVVGSSEDDGCFHIGVVELVVFDEHEEAGGITVDGCARDGEDVLSCLRDKMKFGPETGAEAAVLIGKVEGGFDRASLGIGDGPDVSEGGGKCFTGEGWQMDAGGLADDKLGGEVLGDLSRGFDGTEIQDFHQDLIGADRLADGDVNTGDNAGHGGGKHDGGRRITGLTAFNPDELVAFLDLLIRAAENGEGAARDAAADEGAFAGENCDATEGKEGGLKRGFLGFSGFEAEVGLANFIKDDGVGETVG
jgi:hypothetical protein